MNSLGHRVWGQATGKRVSVDTRKMHTILTTAIRGLPKASQEEAWEDMSDTLGWLRAAKRDGYVPPRWHGSSRFNAGTLREWLAPYPEEPTDLQCQLIDDALLASIEASYAGGLDFDDQIYMPVCFGASWPRFPLVMID